jgi:DNA-binding transcriptional MerR regulator
MIVALTQCTRDQLGYYQEIGLLALRKPSTDGSREYDDLDLLRLQQIRVGRSRGLALEEIRRWLEACAGPFPSDVPRSVRPSGASRCAPAFPVRDGLTRTLEHFAPRVIALPPSKGLNCPDPLDNHGGAGDRSLTGVSPGCATRPSR